MKAAQAAALLSGGGAPFFGVVVASPEPSPAALTTIAPQKMHSMHLDMFFIVSKFLFRKKKAKR